MKWLLFVKIHFPHCTAFLDQIMSINVPLAAYFSQRNLNYSEQGSNEGK